MTKDESYDQKPMYLWKWEDVVTFVEEIEEMKHFASVFWQYKIDGKELCTMIEYMLRSNLKNQHQVWPISQEAAVLKQHIDKTRVQQHI